MKRQQVRAGSQSKEYFSLLPGWQWSQSLSPTALFLPVALQLECPPPSWSIEPTLWHPPANQTPGNRPLDPGGLLALPWNGLAPSQGHAETAAYSPSPSDRLHHCSSQFWDMSTKTYGQVRPIKQYMLSPLYQSLSPVCLFIWLDHTELLQCIT